MNITITEGRLPHVSAVARTDEIGNVANYVWSRLYPAIRDVRAAVEKLDEGLHGPGVEDATTLLDGMVSALSELCDNIQGQTEIQIEYRRGDR
jgi:hypothetical protein